jgi:trehalose 6-phosphate phosphatase
MPTAYELSAPPPLDDLSAQGPIALFVDFDGTLIDIAESPSGIAVPEELAGQLAGLSTRVEGRLALVSGRSVENLEEHLGPLRLACAGSHGAARRGADGTWLGERPSPLDASIVREVETFAAAAGAAFEPKAHGAALHSRSAPSIEERCGLFMDDLASRHGLAVKRGKFVAELVRPGADKGAAVRAFMESAPFAGAMPVFIGDDVTDEDGFASALAAGGLAITVGPRDSRHATYGLADPAAVHHWLGL